ncbi:MAG: putative transposase [Bacteroidales bacterium]
MILDQILPELFENVAIKITDQQLKADPDLTRFTLVFDGEISGPEFFAKLWSEYRVAILTYKKM